MDLTHYVVDCSTGTTKDLTHQEAIADPAVGVDEQFEEKRVADLERQAAVQKQRDADLAAIKDKAKTDPAFAALARHLGIT